MFYKNAYPEDFEKLHNGKDALYEICQLRPRLIKQSREKLSDQIKNINDVIAASEAELTESTDELIQSFIGYCSGTIDLAT